MTEPLETNEAYFRFLDEIRESGVTNMFGAAPYLREMWPELNREEAKAIVILWMKTYEKGYRGIATEATG
jgi:hypothetical protein